jgi:3-hydroxypropanoate dehydrogenase
VDSVSLKDLFLEARTANGYTDKEVSPDLLKRVYDLAKWGPTSMNTQPTRYVFITSAEAKDKLVPLLSPGNVAKVKSAPVTVIVARDTQFYEHMPAIWHREGTNKMFADDANLARATAQRNATLGGAWFMMAARAHGLDCGPMSGFNAQMVNQTFFPDGRYEADFLLNLGWADHSLEMPRNKRLDFEQVAQFL